MNEQNHGNIAWSKPLTVSESQGTIIITSTPPVGFWVLYPGAPLTTKFGMYVRPSDEQIKNTQELLGWGWEDA
jgi:hypothetical protein